MEFDHLGASFHAKGYQLAAISVDVPQRAAALRTQLQLNMTLLCDVTRETVRGWDLYNPRERGGIAVPATVVVGADQKVQGLWRESMARRLGAAELLDWLEHPQRRLRPRMILPRWRSWRRALGG